VVRRKSITIHHKVSSQTQPCLLLLTSPPRNTRFHPFNLTAFPFAHSANNKIQPPNKILFIQQLTFVSKEKLSNDPFHRRINSAKKGLFISYDKVPLPQSKLRGESQLVKVRRSKVWGAVQTLVPAAFSDRPRYQTERYVPFHTFGSPSRSCIF
jgi:hypothetical protein